MTPSANPTRYKNHRFPGEIIRHGVWLYYRFTLSDRDVQELLWERGIEVSHEAIRKWCGKFGQDYANQLKRRWPRPGDKWYMAQCTDGAIGGNKITCIAVCVFCTGNFALFQPISAPGRAQIHINTSVVEQHNGTSRLRNRRKVRKTLTFSKATRYHRWMSWLSVGLYNFCHAHSSLKIKQEAQVSHRSPAMAAKLADHIWSTREWLLCPVLGE
jgi:hypothetical protein